MNIDELKSNWNSMDVPPAYHGENVREILSRVESGRVSTLRDRLSGIFFGNPDPRFFRSLLFCFSRSDAFPHV